MTVNAVLKLDSHTIPKAEDLLTNIGWRRVIHQTGSEPTQRNIRPLTHTVACSNIIACGMEYRQQLASSREPWKIFCKESLTSSFESMTF